MEPMPIRPPRRRRARPVADAPLEALLPASERLAKGWLLALIEDAPLADAPSIVAEGVVRDGPRLCEAVLRALASDTELEREKLRAPVVPSPAPAAPEAISQAVDALRAVLWSALLSELRDPDPELVAALSERLALVIELVRGTALRSAGTVEGGSWVSALDAEIDRANRSGTRLSLLLIELEDAERVLAVEPVDEARAILGRVMLAIEDATTPQDMVTGEAHGRAWVIAPDTDKEGALALASRIDDALRTAGEWRGAPLTVSVGIAVLGEDASERPGLIEAAEKARFAAAAGGITVTRGESGDR